MDNDSIANRFLNRRLKILSDLSGLSDKSQPEGDNDSITPMNSPIDVLPFTELGSMAAKGVGAIGKAALEGAPRHLGNEIGSVGNLKKLVPAAYESPTLGKNLTEEANEAVRNITQKSNIAPKLEEANDQEKFSELLKLLKQ